MLKETDFIETSELEILGRCKKFVEDELQVQHRLLERSQDNKKVQRYVKFTIAKMEYALGIRDRFPSVKEVLEKE